MRWSAVYERCTVSMIAIVDYGVGNLFSLTSSLHYLGLEAKVTSAKEDLFSADRIILPGVGAFGDAKKKLDSSGLVDILLEEANSGKPFLGICLGMQLLFDKSFEYGVHGGLSLIHGSVVPIESDLKQPLKVPHMGWNALHFRKQDRLFKYVNEGQYVYFVHSYYAKDCEADTIATADYSFPITAAVGRANIYGTQFHPEKSGSVGLKILKAFSEI